jgi:hypothetical protein
LQQFLQSLFATLQSHAVGSSAQNTASISTGNSDTGACSAASDTQGVDGSGGPLTAALQSLIQSLSGSSGTSSASDTSSATGATSATAGSPESTLQSSFDKLVTAIGDSSGSASLSGFLQALAGQLDGASSIGSLVNTQA